MAAQTRPVSADAVLTPAWAFAAYESIRDRLPRAEGAGEVRPIANLSEIAADFDLILFDAYGVLNLGDHPIPGAADRIASLRASGTAMMVVSNSAAYPKPVMIARYRRLGLDFSAAEVVSSRDAMNEGLKTHPDARWGLMGEPQFDLSDLAPDQLHMLGDDPADYDRAERFILLGSGGWTDHRQGLLEASLRARPRPVVVGNPDLVAPRETGFTLEPGYFAHQLADIAGVAPEFYGKPYRNAFDLALSKAPVAPARDRVLMVGDTLHTDILGGNAMGFQTALVTGFGSLQGLDIEQACATSGIMPDYVMERI